MIIREGHTYLVNSVAFSPDGKSVVSGSSDKTVRIWDARITHTIGEPLRGHGHRVYSVSCSPLGSLIASGSHDKTIRLWDTNTAHQSGEALKGDAPFHSVAFSPDGKFIASGCGNSFASTGNVVQLWDMQTRQTASRPFQGHTHFVHSVSFSPDGTRVVSGSWDKTIRVWDVERGRTIAESKGHTGWVRSTAFSPNGTQILSCSDDGTIRFWDARTGRRTIGEPYTGHTGAVYSAAFSPCGTYIASGGDDETVRLWDIRIGRQVDQPFKEHTGAVYSVEFSPPGQHIASGSNDRKVIIRKVSSEYPDFAGDPNSDEDLEPQMVNSQMSTQEMFQCLVGAGCNDLSPMMDSSQDAARIVSGGGFGDIWKGELNNGKKVAVKAWRTDALEQCRYKALKRAARELYYWSRMEHNNIHRLMGVIIFRDEYLGMVSEWMENGDLHKYLRHHPDANRYRLCIDVASGLEYMHDRSTVHGDLKAANVLVSPDGVARISDFDFSVMFEASNLLFTASSNSRAGSVRWVALEMLNGNIPNRTRESDVYALGMTMLEIFTGQVPYSDLRMDFAVMMAVMQGTLPTRPVQNLKDNEQGNLVWSLLLNCWSQNLSARPSVRKVVEILGSLPGEA